MLNKSNRRQFLKTSALTGVGFWFASRSISEDSPPSANDRIAIAAIGLGNQGNSDTNNVSKYGDMVAICDVDETRLNAAGEKRFPKAKRYTDYRKMLDEMGKSINAVTVSTPDHHHAPAAIMAMRMGKHCYCQKPLTRSIYEARTMAKVAREMKVATQMGNQGTADNALRNAVAVIQAGTLGKPKEVHVWTNRPIWPQGKKRPEPIPCPETLNWDLWIGPRPMRPYAKGYHPFDWRGWWDFGTGALGDMACHTLNMPFWALGLRDPISVQAETTGHDQDYFPSKSQIVYEFPATDTRPAVKMFWYDGGNLPSDEVLGPMYDLYKKQIELKNDFLQSGCVVVGDKDTLYVPGDYAEKLTKLSDNKPLPKVEYEKTTNHYQEWIEAAKGGKPAKSNFPDYSGALTEVVLLGNLAVWVANKGKGEKVEWDAKNLKCTNIEGLEQLIKPVCRTGYSIE